MKEAKIITRTADDRRRVQLPDECPAGAAVSVQEIDSGRWLVSLVKREDVSGWRIVKACDCKGASKPGFPTPICAKCGKSWRFESEKPAAGAPAV